MNSLNTFGGAHCEGEHRLIGITYVIESLHALVADLIAKLPHRTAISET